MHLLTDFLQTTQGKLIAGAIALTNGPLCILHNDPPLDVSDEEILVQAFNLKQVLQ